MRKNATNVSDERMNQDWFKLIQQGRFQDAIQPLSQAIENNNYKAYFYRGFCYLKLGMLEKGL